MSHNEEKGIVLLATNNYVNRNVSSVLQMQQYDNVTEPTKKTQIYKTILFLYNSLVMRFSDSMFSEFSVAPVKLGQGKDSLP